MTGSHHRIRKQTLVLDVESEAQARALQPHLGPFNRGRLLAIIEQVFDAVDVPGLHVRIDRLDVDLGTVSSNDFESVVAERLALRLREVVEQAVRERRSSAPPGEQPRTEAQFRLELMEYYLVHGTLPFWAPTGARFSFGALFTSVAENDPEALVRLIGRHAWMAQVIQRLVLQLDQPLLERLLTLLEPKHAAILIDYIISLQALHRVEPVLPLSDQKLSHLLWSLTLTYLVRDAGSQFNRKSAMRQLLEGVSESQGLGYTELVTTLALGLDQIRQRHPVLSSLASIIGELVEELPPEVSATVTATREETREEGWDDEPARMAATVRYTLTEALRYYLQHGVLPWSTTVRTPELTVERALSALPELPRSMLRRALSWESTEGSMEALVRAVRRMPEEVRTRLLVRLMPPSGEAGSPLRSALPVFIARAHDKPLFFARVMAALLDGAPVVLDAFAAPTGAPPREPPSTFSTEPRDWGAHALKAVLAQRLRDGQVGSGEPSVPELLEALLAHHPEDARLFLLALRDAEPLRRALVVMSPRPLFERVMEVLRPREAGTMGAFLSALEQLPERVLPGGRMEARQAVFTELLRLGETTPLTAATFLQVVSLLFGRSVSSDVTSALAEVVLRWSSVGHLPAKHVAALREALRTLGFEEETEATPSAMPSMGSEDDTTSEMHRGDEHSWAEASPASSNPEAISATRTEALRASEVQLASAVNMEPTGVGGGTASFAAPTPEGPRVARTEALDSSAAARRSTESSSTLDTASESISPPVHAASTPDARDRVSARTTTEAALTTGVDTLRDRQPSSGAESLQASRGDVLPAWGDRPASTPQADTNEQQRPPRSREFSSSTTDDTRGKLDSGHQETPRIAESSPVGEGGEVRGAHPDSVQGLSSPSTESPLSMSGALLPGPRQPSVEQFAVHDVPGRTHASPLQVAASSRTESAPSEANDTRQTLRQGTSQAQPLGPLESSQPIGGEETRWAARSDTSQAPPLTASESSPPISSNDTRPRSRSGMSEVLPLVSFEPSSPIRSGDTQLTPPPGMSEVLPLVSSEPSHSIRGGDTQLTPPPGMSEVLPLVSSGHSHPISGGDTQLTLPPGMSEVLPLVSSGHSHPISDGDTQLTLPPGMSEVLPLVSSGHSHPISGGDTQLTLPPGISEVPPLVSSKPSHSIGGSGKQLTPPPGMSEERPLVSSGPSRPSSINDVRRTPRSDVSDEMQPLASSEPSRPSSINDVKRTPRSNVSDEMRPLASSEPSQLLDTNDVSVMPRPEMSEAPSLTSAESLSPISGEDMRRTLRSDMSEVLTLASSEVSLPIGDNDTRRSPRPPPREEQTRASAEPSASTAQARVQAGPDIRGGSPLATSPADGGTPHPPGHLSTQEQPRSSAAPPASATDGTPRTRPATHVGSPLATSPVDTGTRPQSGPAPDQTQVHASSEPPSSTPDDTSRVRPVIHDDSPRSTPPSFGPGAHQEPTRSWAEPPTSTTDDTSQARPVLHDGSPRTTRHPSSPGRHQEQLRSPVEPPASTADDTPRTATAVHHGSPRSTPDQATHENTTSRTPRPDLDAVSPSSDTAERVSRVGAIPSRSPAPGTPPASPDPTLTNALPSSASPLTHDLREALFAFLLGQSADRYAGLSDDALLRLTERTLEDTPELLLGFFRQHLSRPHLREHWARVLPESLLARLTALLAPRMQASMLATVELLSDAWNDVARAGGISRPDRPALWRFILELLGHRPGALLTLEQVVTRFLQHFAPQLRGSPANDTDTPDLIERLVDRATELARSGSAHRLESLLRRRRDVFLGTRATSSRASPRHTRGSASDSRRTSFRLGAEAHASDVAPIYIGNAGLVLTSPFVPHLLREVGLSRVEDGKAFLDPEPATRAVHLLQYLVDGSTSTPEPLLVLNKILCGLPIPTPVPASIQLTEQEQSLCDRLLRAVIAHWKIISNTSVAGLRETFLQREGRLEHLEDRWKLQVQRKTLDVLVDQVPWSLSIITHPWMPQPLYVSW
ncbi:hypothetical protein LZ198_15525 [Myxococcus sp. K15C18031901]|uniref:contractile injection system tape measure protein n=1 Tax=Myxococcus dinghuensis TaxID=2906761 RepID=UPI0020A78187|nr:contractile injection system tape measure protein [Myxococcus dinghuensis]MCP3100280.1 hypothetical protein [Myxococcus dinghuensis]